VSGNPPAGRLANAAEAGVVALARAGDRTAFAELVRRREHYVRSLLRRLSRDPALADDLSQETFLTVWRQLHRLQTVAAFGGWLRQIAVNTWLQHLRRKTPAELLADECEAGAPGNEGEAIDLEAALAMLPPLVRLCIVLAYHEGLSHAQIAGATQLPLGTVKSHITRGTASLRIMLAAYMTPASREIA
jgi:RNA polymerase sigma factor (sigma-70 family)